MLKCPQFKPHVQVEIRRGDGVFLLTEMQQTLLQGRVYEAVAPLLDGRPVEAVCRELAGWVPPTHVFYALNRLEQSGVLCECDQTQRNGVAAFWTLQGIDPQVAEQNLCSSTVSIASVGIEAEGLTEQLNRIGVHVAADAELQIVVTDHYLRPEIAAINRQALDRGQRWLLVKPVGVNLWVGPLFIPGRTGCWNCLATRMRSNFPVLGYLENSKTAGESVAVPDRAQTAASRSIAWGLAANAVATLCGAPDRPSLYEGRIHTLNLLTMQAESHMLLRQPSCPACAPPRDEIESRTTRPVRLKSCRKSYTDDGGHRALTPQETLDRYSYHVSSICGAVTELRKCTPTNDGVMHVFVSGNNAARGPQSLRGLKTDLRHASAGKGISEVQAKASALCEGLERYSGTFRGDEPRITATSRDLGDSAIHPNACMLFSDRQFRLRDELNQTSSIYNYIPLPFDEQQSVEWSPAWSLTQQRTRYLPTAFCYYNYPSTYDTDFCVGCSNGNAAGNSLEEAVFQGFLELAERDSVSIWWYNRLRVPGVDLDRLGEPYLDKLREYLASQGREFWVLDVTSDLQIPAFVSVSRKIGGPSEQIMFGFGAHLEPRIAILRAVTEMNQMLVPLIMYPEDKLPGFLSDADTLSWLKQATIAEQTYVLPQDGALSDSTKYAPRWTDDIREDILYCQKKIESSGMEIIVLDQTRPEIGMPVVKVIVPGLRHFWRRYAPGRLYDVPVALGQLNRPHTEDELNPIPMFL